MGSVMRPNGLPSTTGNMSEEKVSAKLMFRDMHLKHMRLYHGSDQPVREPKILHSKRTMDFGEGFYTTQSEQQATEWAMSVSRRSGSMDQYVTEYDYDESEGLKILTFDEPTEEWFDFVISNRNGQSDHDYDIVIGPVADDRVYDTLMEYSRSYITREMAIAKLKTHKFDGQVLFHTDKSLKHITYVRDWKV